MKRKLIIGLVCLNAGLLIALVLGAGTQQAKAQMFPTTDYLLMTSQITTNLDGVCVVDLGTKQMAAWRLRGARNRYTLARFQAIRHLERDFRRIKPAPVADRRSGK